MAGDRAVKECGKPGRRAGAGAAFRLVVFALLAAVLLAASPAEARKWAYLDSRGKWRTIDESQTRTKPLSEATSETILTGNISWNVTYLDAPGDGFLDPDLGGMRRACVMRALSAIGAAVGDGQSGTLDVVMAPSYLDGSGFLAIGGTYFPDASSPPGFYNGFAFDHLKTGVDPSPDLEDLYCTVDFGYSWYYGYGTPQADEYDLTSVLLHEFTHGMGFMSLMNSNGLSVISNSNPGIYSGFDSKLYTATALNPLFFYTGRFIDISANLIGSSPGIVFAGYNTGKACKGWPRVYTPASFADGTSLSHWDPNIAGGAVMVPQMVPGKVRRVYAPADKAVLADTGWRVKGIQASAVAPGWERYR